MAAPESPVNIAERLATFDEHWSPKIIAEANGWELKVVKVQGEFVWHDHDTTDEIFLVLDGELTIRLRDRPDVHLRQGELYVVPRGVVHQPVAVNECRIMLIEPAGIINTGDVSSDLTAQDEWI